MLNVKKLREMAGTSVKELADLCDVSPSTYRRWEQDPDSIPHGRWVDIVAYLQIALSIKKEKPMSKHIGNIEVREPNEGSDMSELAVPVPEGLTEQFEPERPLSDREWINWLNKGVEPYPGFADAYNQWEAAWEEVGRAHRAALGYEDIVVDMPERVPTYDDDGSITDLDMPTLLVTGEGADQKAYVDLNRPDPNDPDTVPTQEELDAALAAIPPSDEPDVYED